MHIVERLRSEALTKELAEEAAIEITKLMSEVQQARDFYTHRESKAAYNTLREVINIIEKERQKIASNFGNWY